VAEILRLKQLRQANYLRAKAGAFGDAVQSLFQILFRLGAARHLDQSHSEFLRRQAFKTSIHKYNSCGIQIFMEAAMALRRKCFQSKPAID
jgi:hypothetical protein